MAGPIYVFLKDQSGVDIKGSCTVQGREGAIDAFSFVHNLYTPWDAMSGRPAGQCHHQEIVIEKDIDRSTPFLYRAIQKGETFKEATVKWYRTNESGREYEYFNTILTGVKVVSVTPHVPNPTKTDSPHQTHTEFISLRYTTITWLYLDGNLRFTAS
ncbi:Hcp family type VI secretion system effector [Caballeronia grimmiae]|uniref:Hcp family type VI secretion system effector n=1 Tax=Caballeronia grimmiae TaxID=1071679 RepID=A0ABQ1RUF1_9BURK|nr:type VI secretion system tube protein TssD [Caballeronia grimmiae]GGD78369.1 Hcp family type VI secretion system effector [Caballeronia grimmiae]